MNSVNQPQNINTRSDDLGHQYNFQHFVFVTKYRNKVLNNKGIIEIAREAFYHAAATHHIEIKLLSFGDDFAHVHMEVKVPNTMSVSQAAQMLKGYSAWALFKELPYLRKDHFWGGHFWTAGYSNSSVGPQNEEVIQNYIRRQDISGKVS